MKKQFVIALHVAYWLCYALLLAVIMLLIYMQVPFRQKGVPPYHFPFVWLLSVMTIVPAILSFYGAYFVLMPRFLATKKFMKLSIVGLGMAFFAALIATGLTIPLFPRLFVVVQTLQGFVAQMFLPFMLACIHGVLGLILSGFVRWFEENRIKSALQEQNLSMELALIKAQLDPHFLFNTLNNIDVLIERDSVRASAYLQKLSSILRFILYDAKAALMPLGEELEHIRNYIDLQKIRTANPDFIRFSVEGAWTAREVAPMLFMPFIENAFKFAEHRKTGTAVNITFTLHEEQCMFVCENSYSNNTPQNKEQSGLGASLIRRRLELLYPARHRLSICDNDHVYRVELILFTNPMTNAHAPATFVHHY